MDTAKLILIARVSDKSQVKALPAQKLRLENYAKSKELPFEYHEFNESAYKVGPREKFLKLVRRIEAQKQPCIVVFDKVDRFSRDSSQEEVKIMGHLVRQGRIEMHFPSDNLFINKHSPASDLFRMGIDLVLSKYYSDTSRDNVNRRFEQLLEDKHWIGAAPLGYLNVNMGTEKKPNKIIIKDPERWQHIVKIFELRATGMTYQQIAKVINKAGLRSKKGKKMTKKIIEDVCRRHFYYGKMCYKGQLLPHKYEPIITYKLFVKCQNVREQRGENRTAYNGRQFAFKGLIRCAKCGCSMCTFYAKGIPYLKCSGAKGKCGNMNTAQSLIMPEILKTLSGIAIPPDVIPLVLDELKKRHENQNYYFEQNLTTARKEYDRTTERIKALTYERLDGRVPADLYDEMLNDLTNRQQELNEQVEALTDSNKSFLISASYLLDLAQRAFTLFQSSPEELQRKLLKFVLSNLVLDDKRLFYKVNHPYNIFIELKKKSLDGSESANWCKYRYFP